MSFNSKSSLMMDQQLKVQELCVRFSDTGLYSASGNSVSVDVGETLVASVACLDLDNSAASCLMIAAADQAVAGSVLTVTLAAPFAANDVLILKYITKK